MKYLGNGEYEFRSGKKLFAHLGQIGINPASLILSQGGKEYFLGPDYLAIPIETQFYGMAGKEIVELAEFMSQTWEQVRLMGKAKELDEFKRRNCLDQYEKINGFTIAELKAVALSMQVKRKNRIKKAFNQMMSAKRKVSRHALTAVLTKQKEISL